MQKFSRVLLQSYTALRLSAGAVVLDLPFETREDRPPIVRSSTNGGPAGFDRREIILWGNAVCVVTLPVAQRASQPPAFVLN